MYAANILAFFSKTTDALKWVGLAVAVLVVAFLMADLIINIKKRKRVKMNITALVFLLLALLTYILTQWVLTDLPAFVGFIWVAFLGIYLIFDIILAVGIGRDNRHEKKGLGDKNDGDDASDTEGDDQTKRE